MQPATERPVLFFTASARPEGNTLRLARAAATGLPGAPMVSVGARTTSEHEVAIWSNTGSWVMAYGAGASVVSTMPTTFNGSRRSGLAQPAAPGQPARGTGDSDDFSGGFGVWSGTSFSTPALAGEIAAALAADQAGRIDSDRVKRAQKAVAAVLQDAP